MRCSSARRARRWALRRTGWVTRSFMIEVQIVPSGAVLVYWPSAPFPTDLATPTAHFGLRRDSSVGLRLSKPAEGALPRRQILSDLLAWVERPLGPRTHRRPGRLSMTCSSGGLWASATQMGKIERGRPKAIEVARAFPIGQAAFDLTGRGSRGDDGRRSAVRGG